MPTQERLRELFDYRNGQLINRLSRNNAPAGSVVGFWNESYYKCNIDGKRDTVHRAIWIWHYGSIPEKMQIDHIDRDRRNNHIENLRLVTRSENMRNRNRYSRRPDPTPGIQWISYEQKWRAMVALPNGKRLYLAKSSDKHRLIWLMHLYKKGIYKPNAKIKPEAHLDGGLDGIPRLRGDQEPDDVQRAYRDVIAELEANGFTVERRLPPL